MQAMERKINFNAGPAELPGEVLHELSKATLKYKKTGMSVWELPHRGAEFLEILEESKQVVRELCGIGPEYEVMWMQGGGRMQFCMVPMNFLPQNGIASYIDSGSWAAEAASYAQYYGRAEIVTTSEGSKYRQLPNWPTKIPMPSSYLHFTTNNTIFGTQRTEPGATQVPLIADMSSDIYCMQRDYTRYSMFYAAAQKNLGAAGTALAVVHKDLLKQTARALPPMLSYEAHAAQNSLVNTANVGGVYTALLMLRWTKAKGIAAIEAENRAKAEMLYDLLDEDNLFEPVVLRKEDRSMMNVCFKIKDVKKEQALLELCERKNIVGIKGHRSVGGFRVSIYNAVPVASVTYLISVLRDFAKRN